jgi:hypothetical protein
LWRRRRLGMANQETSPTEIDHLLSLLGEQYEHLRKIAEETFRNLCKEQAGYFTRLENDWIDTLSAILNTYSKDELFDSLMYIHFSGLFKEVYWFELLFLAGNYPLLHRSLRFVWEMIFRAYHVDTYSPDDPEPPGPTVDDKVEWLARHEREMFQWKEFMKPTLQRLLPQAKGTEIEKYYRPLWDRLNEYVHPSKALLDRMISNAGVFLVTDTFDKEWALETIGTATVVFDLVWLAVISRFPRSAELIAQKRFHLEYPIVTTALENFSREDLMTKRLVFLYDSTIQPWHANLQVIQKRLNELQTEGVKSELLDTKDMPEEELEHWREEATITAMWRHQRIRQVFGSQQQYLGKQVPALLVYQEGERVPVAVYPHSEKRGQKHTDFSIEGFLEEFVKALGG